MSAEWLTNIIDGFAIMSGWEITAALLGLAYIILAARESLWCWPMAFISTLIYTALFWEGQLPMQALLNFYYMAMAIYGFVLWRQHQQTTDNLVISSWAWNKQFYFLILGTALSAITAHYLLLTETSQRPYLDASITIFSVMNTWLMAKKVLQNWLYWVAIDCAAITLYLDTGYYATAALFTIYTMLAVAGFIRWSQTYRNKQANAPSI